MFYNLFTSPFVRFHAASPFSKSYFIPGKDGSMATGLEFFPFITHTAATRCSRLQCSHQSLAVEEIERERELFLTENDRCFDTLAAMVYYGRFC